MFNYNDEQALRTLCEQNPEFNQIINKLNDEYKFTISRITHEIKNPLTLINSTLQLLEKKYPDIKNSNYWNQVLFDMKDLFSLLDQLSDYNHSDVLHKSSNDLIALLLDLKVSFDSFALSKKATITLHLDSGCNTCLHNYNFDYIKIKQVFTNLIKNAVEAVNYNGHIQISVSTKPLFETNTPYYCISISNEGEPIPDSMREKIFSPFVSTKQTGTGLGLPTAKRIIDSHFGYITVTSTKEETTFSVYLPVI